MRIYTVRLFIDYSVSADSSHEAIEAVRDIVSMDDARPEELYAEIVGIGEENEL